MWIFDGPYCFGSSICRLRVSAAQSQHPRVVVATDLADSPGPSVCNAFETLVAAVSKNFGEESTRWLLHSPEFESLDSDISAWIEATPGPNGPKWRPDVSREEAEAISGHDLPGVDTEPATVVQLAGEGTLLAGLACAPEPERLPGEYMRAVPVAALPFPHSPFRCPHEKRFDEIACFYSGDDPTVAGAHWFLTLASEDFKQCSYHERDWQKIADASLAVLDAIGPQGSRDDVRAACAEQNLSSEDFKALGDLFADPIIWTPGAPELTNGQHRTCALRAAGAEFCVVDTSGHAAPSSYAASPRAAASTALAVHWATMASRE
jgi:hypothetical protein